MLPLEGRCDKVGTHEGTSPCDWSPEVWTRKKIVAGTSLLKSLKRLANLGLFN